MIIDMRPMKNKAQKFPSVISNLILSEPDFLEEGEFFAKSDVWFKGLMQARSGEKS